MKLRLSMHLVVAALSLAALALVAGDEAQASNMAFKMNKSIPAVRHLVALPFRNPLIKANDVCAALNLPSVVGPPRATVTQYDTAAGGTPASFTCGDSAGSAPTLKLRLGLEISSPTATSGIIVGSHVPGQALYVINDFVGFPDAYNIVAVPYHTTAVTLADICVQAGLPGNGPAIGADSTVTRYDSAGTPVQYTCGDAVGPGLGLVLGEAVEVLTPITTPPIFFTPPHF